MSTSGNSKISDASGPSVIKNSPKGRLASGIAAATVLIFVILAVYLLVAARGSTETEWQRLIDVFSTVAVVAFTTVGWIFGREVSRSRVENAEVRFQEAEKSVQAAMAKAADLRARGLAAKAAINARVGAGEARTDIDVERLVEARDDSRLQELAVFMNELFADV